jgi:hypothetical protein
MSLLSAWSISLDSTFNVYIYTALHKACVKINRYSLQAPAANKIKHIHDISEETKANIFQKSFSFNAVSSMAIYIVSVGIDTAR